MCGCEEPKISLRQRLKGVAEQFFDAQDKFREGLVALVQARTVLTAIAAEIPPETAPEPPPTAAPEPVSPPASTVWVPSALLVDALKRLETMEARFEAMEGRNRTPMAPIFPRHDFLAR